MWIDFSDDKEEVSKTEVCIKDIEEPNIVSSPNTVDQNSTYVIHKGPPVIHSPVIIDEDNRSTSTPKLTFDGSNIGQKSPCEPEKDALNENTLINQLEDVCTESVLAPSRTTTSRRRGSSSIFMETLRKLVCMHERFDN